jgi:hypothetical protein
MVNMTLRILSKPGEEKLATIFKVWHLQHAGMFMESTLSGLECLGWVLDGPGIVWPITPATKPTTHDAPQPHAHQRSSPQIWCQSHHVAPRTHRPAPSALQSLGQDWDERVLPSIGNEVVKAVVAQYNAEQLLTQREKVSLAVCPPPLSCAAACCLSKH